MGGKVIDGCGFRVDGDFEAEPAVRIEPLVDLVGISRDNERIRGGQARRSSAGWLSFPKPFRSDRTDARLGEQIRVTNQNRSTEGTQDLASRLIHVGPPADRYAYHH
jgi:hypothetical protein